MPKPSENSKILKSLDKRKFKKQLLPNNIEQKKKIIEPGSFVVFKYGIEKFKSIDGKVIKTEDRGCRIGSDFGEFHILWERIERIYAASGTISTKTIKQADPKTLEIFNKTIEKIIEISMEGKYGQKFNLVDKESPKNYYLRTVSITYSGKFFSISIVNDGDLYMLCESNFKRKSKLKFEGDEILISPVMARLRVLKKLFREDEKRERERVRAERQRKKESREMTRKMKELKNPKNQPKK
jgi:hypothetical protein